MLPLTRRVLARYLAARATIGPDLKKVEHLVLQREFADALQTLDETLNKKLQIRVFPHREEAHILTEWVHSLDASDESRFMEVAEKLINARNKLLWVPKDPDSLREMSYSVQKLLDDAQRDVPWLERMMRGEEDTFKHGNYTIIVTEGATGSLDQAIETLDRVSDLVGSKFPKVLYGKVYVRKDLRVKGTYETAPEAKGTVGGSYVAAGDFIALSIYTTPNRNSVDTLIHELGHRYHTRFLGGDKREKFIELFTTGDVHREHFPLSEREKIADELVLLYREHQQERYPDPDSFLSERARLWLQAYTKDEWRKVVPLLRRFRDDLDESVVPALRDALMQSQYGGNLEVITNESELEPLYASMYGATSWQENFAEAFLKYVTGRVLPEPLEAFMRSL